MELLVERGAPADVADGSGRTPLFLAVKACVDSYWTERRSSESVEALLVSIGATRLRRLGFRIVSPIESPELRLYELLAKEDSDAYTSTEVMAATGEYRVG